MPVQRWINKFRFFVTREELQFRGEEFWFLRKEMGLLPRIRIPLRRNSISYSCWKNARSFPEKTKLFWQEKVNKVFFWEETLLSSQDNYEYSFGRIPYFKWAYLKNFCFCPSPRNEYSFFKLIDFAFMKTHIQKVSCWKYLCALPKTQYFIEQNLMLWMLFLIVIRIVFLLTQKITLKRIILFGLMIF